MSKKYYVKEGKAIVTKMGMKEAGDEITPAMFSGGIKTIQAQMKTKKGAIEYIEEKIIQKQKPEKVGTTFSAGEKSEKKSDDDGDIIDGDDDKDFTLNPASGDDESH